ncbi:TlpA family protein disulfide reductase [Labilibacter sediminis]|nr:TlpA family protein disulfide reductase [Labilibacter sediminis]
MIANAQDESGLVVIGDMAPEFQLNDGKETITLSSLKGKVVLVNFFATWCPPCRKELPYVEEQVWKKYKNNPNFKLLVVGRNHSQEELIAFNKDKFEMPFYPDKDRQIFSKFAINTIPRNYVINKQGKIIYASTGFTLDSFSEMLKVIDKALKL